MLQQVQRWLWKRRWQSLAALVLLSAIGCVLLIGASESVRKCEQAELQANPAEPVGNVLGYHPVSGHCDWTYFGENDKPLTVLATVGLLFVTAGLAWYTARLWRETKRLADDAAKEAESQRGRLEQATTAAIDNAKAAQALATASMVSERAFVFFKTDSQIINNDLSSNWTEHLTVKVSFVNLGKTPAQVEAMEISFRVWDLNALDVLTDTPTGTLYPLNFWLGNGVASDPQSVPVAARQEDLNRVHAGKAVLVLVGRVNFLDVFGDAYTTGFAYEMSRQTRRLVPFQNRRLNYSRSTKRPQ